MWKAGFEYHPVNFLFINTIGNNGGQQTDPSGDGSGNNSSEPWKTLGKAGFSNSGVDYFKILLDKN